MAQPVPTGVVPAAESGVLTYAERERQRLRLRNKRWRHVKAKTEDLRHLTRRKLRIIYGDPDGPPEPPEPRPKTRADCIDQDRPCPWVGCRHHLYLDVHPESGNIKLNFPDLEPEELPVSCALDVAADEGNTLEEIAQKMNLTRERVRQIEVIALAKLKRRMRPEDLASDDHDD